MTIYFGFISGTMNWQKKSETQAIQAPAQIPIVKVINIEDISITISCAQISSLQSTKYMQKLCQREVLCDVA